MRIWWEPAWGKAACSACTLLLYEIGWEEGWGRLGSCNNPCVIFSQKGWTAGGWYWEGEGVVRSYQKIWSHFTLWKKNKSLPFHGGGWPRPKTNKSPGNQLDRKRSCLTRHGSFRFVLSHPGLITKSRSWETEFQTGKLASPHPLLLSGFRSSPHTISLAVWCKSGC